MTAQNIKKTALILTLLLASGLAYGQDEHWRPLAPMPTPRYGHVAVALDGKIYVIGGRTSDNDDPLDVVEVYDPVTDTWETNVEPAREERFNAAAVAFDGKIWLIGGREGDDVLDKVEIFDPVSGRWEEGPELKRAREGHAAVVLDSTIYVIGGFGENMNLVAQSEYLDLSKGEWRLSSDWTLMVPRVATATVVVRDSAFTMGGVRVVPIPMVERYHAQSGVAMRSPMPAARADFAAAAVGDSIYVFGGFGMMRGQPALIEEVELFVPATGVWSTVSTLEVPREGLAAAIVERQVFLFGGRTADGSASDLAQEFSPTITSVSTRPASPPKTFVLRQNYPNPFYAEALRAGLLRESGTTLSFVLSGNMPRPVRLQIVNVRGQVVRTLVDRTLAPGEHTVRWDGRDDLGRLVGSGVYLYRLVAGREQQVRRMTILR